MSPLSWAEAFIRLLRKWCCLFSRARCPGPSLCCKWLQQGFAVFSLHPSCVCPGMAVGQLSPSQDWGALAIADPGMQSWGGFMDEQGGWQPLCCICSRAWNVLCFLPLCFCAHRSPCLGASWIILKIKSWMAHLPSVDFPNPQLIPTYTTARLISR